MQFELHIDVSKIATAVILLIFGGVLSACTVLGTGRNTLVLADPPPACIYGGNEFKHLIAAPGKTRLVGLQGKKAHEDTEWETFRNRRLGGVNADAASIDINVRDQTNTPPLDLFNIETVTAADVAKVLTDHTLTTQQKDALLTQLRDNFRGMPETYSRLVSHGAENGKQLYYYFPQVTVDLTGTLNTAETLDRFDFVAAAIRIPDNTDVSFINFSPKVADLFEFTLGQFKQTASATASASTSNKATVNKPTGAPETGASIGGELGYGGSVSFTLTDELTRDIKSSLEARSAGIMKKGKLFLVELRSNEQKHIAGTYSFNVMLQVPSTAEVRHSKDGKTTWTSSIPKVKSIEAEVRVVGIVRHVVKPGTTGVFERVPEPLNDETYRQVVLHDQRVTLWKFTDVPISNASIDSNLTVYSNIDGASFIVVDQTNGKKLAQGTGREAHVNVNTKSKVKVIFVPAIVGGDKPVVLKAPEVAGIMPGNDAYAIGNYLPLK